MHRRFTVAALLAAATLLVPALAEAAVQERCPKLVAEGPPRAIPAAFRLAQLAPEQARITFVGHATFLIESPQGVTIATDYNGLHQPAVTPDIVTMNHAHSTHYTDHPDPGIKHVLRGWNPHGSGPAVHDLALGDVWVSNVTSDTRDWGGGITRDGNSIFLFEVSGVCIAHLGHLHQTLSPQQLARIGRVDVVMVPVDGGYTLNQVDMLEVLKQLNAPVMIPMHFFSGAALERFIDRVGDLYEVERSPVPTVVVARETLPARPKLLVLPGH